MGATLNVRDQVVWMPRIIEFEQALEYIAEELQASDPTMADMLRAPIDRDAFLDLSSLDADQFRKVLSATQQAYKRAVEIEPARRADPQSYFGFMYRFSQLKALMITDPRVVDDTSGMIVISDDTVWQAPAWIMDVVLEAVAAHHTIRPAYPDLARRLLSARGNDGTGALDLRPITDLEFCKVLEGVKWTYQYYVVGKARVSLADDFYTEIATKIDELYQPLQADQRSRGCE